MAVAAIFDIDGTLVTFKFDVQGTRRALIEELKARGVDTTGIDLTTPTQQILDEAMERMGRANQAGYAAYRRRAFEMLDAFELEGAATTKPFPGVRDILVRLKSHGVRLAVLTNSGRKSASEALRRGDLLGLFEFVITRDDAEAMKPRPEGLLKAVHLLSLSKEEVYYIGDSPFDIHAARAAGIRVVSVATGSYSRERLKDEGADYVISSITELGAVLGVQPK